jgi:hypothetical protein
MKGTALVSCTRRRAGSREPPPAITLANPATTPTAIRTRYDQISTLSLLLVHANGDSIEFLTPKAATFGVASIGLDWWHRFGRIDNGALGKAAPWAP